MIFLALIFLPVILATSQNSSATKRGFNLKLIDPFSPLSPFYNPNLTKAERSRRIIESDRKRIHYLSSLQNFNSANYSTDATVIRPGLIPHGSAYMVMVGIGCGAEFHNYYLHIDTGSSLTWITCEPCNPCFPQEPPLFKPEQSSSYRAIMANNPYCKAPDYRPGQNGVCSYSMFYGDYTYAKGTLSSEVFTIASNQGDNVQLPNLIFGCTHEATAGYPLGGPVGILGLDLEPESFVSQAATASVTGRKFSYCLVEAGSTVPMTLRFGEDIIWPPVARVQQTPILRFNSGLKSYFLKLLELSIDNMRLYIEPGTFDRKLDEQGRYRGGFIIDSGSYYTYLPPVAYEVVRNTMVLRMQTHHLLPVQPNADHRDLKLCFNLPRDVDPANILPSMIFHFDGADLPLFYEQVFEGDMSDGQFCLAMLPDDPDQPGVLGTHQQVNTQFEYDVGNGVIRMATVDCVHGV